MRDKLSAETLSKFRRGHLVGELARELFPGGILLQSGTGKITDDMNKLVQNHITLKTNILYEVPFISGDLVAIMDILTYDNGRWNAWEVKSSAEISETYLWDITFQAYVIQQFGLTNIDYHIIHLKKPWDNNSGKEIRELFNTVCVNNEIKSRMADVVLKIEELKSVDLMTKSPQIPVGDHCRYPYECDFIGHCWNRKPNQ